MAGPAVPSPAPMHVHNSRTVHSKLEHAYWNKFVTKKFLWVLALRKNTRRTPKMYERTKMRNGKGFEMNSFTCTFMHVC